MKTFNPDINNPNENNNEEKTINIEVLKEAQEIVNALLEFAKEELRSSGDDQVWESITTVKSKTSKELLAGDLEKIPFMALVNLTTVRGSLYRMFDDFTLDSKTQFFSSPLRWFNKKIATHRNTLEVDELDIDISELQESIIPKEQLELEDDEDSAGATITLQEISDNITAYQKKLTGQ